MAVHCGSLIVGVKSPASTSDPSVCGGSLEMPPFTRKRYDETTGDRRRFCPYSRR
jgi:hypothetical protein